MNLLPIRYVSDVAASQRFYTTLGLAAGPRSRPGGWSELHAGGGVLALHEADQADGGGRRVQLCFESTVALEEVAKALEEAGYPHEGIVDENFGRSLSAADPDGLLVQVNEHDRELYT